MEARDRAAGDRDEERRDDGYGVGVELEIGEGRHLGNPVVAQKQHAQQPHGHGHQRHAEDRVDAADDLVDGQQRGDKVVDQDDPDPCGTGDARRDLVKQLRGAEHEDRTHQHEQQHREDTHELAHAAAEIAPDNLGNAQSVVAYEHHARKIVVHGPHEDAAEGDPQKGHGTEAGAEDGSEDRARTGNVEQLDQENPPARQRHVIHAVIKPSAGCFGSGVGPCNPLQITPIGKIGRDKQGQTDQESNHFRASFCAKIKRICDIFPEIVAWEFFFSDICSPEREGIRGSGCARQEMGGAGNRPQHPQRRGTTEQ